MQTQDFDFEAAAHESHRQYQEQVTVNDRLQADLIATQCDLSNADRRLSAIHKLATESEDAEFHQLRSILKDIERIAGEK